MRVVAIGLGAATAFFIFYTARLLVVTGFLQQILVGGHGAYIGAIAFPVLADPLLRNEPWGWGFSSGWQGLP